MIKRLAVFGLHRFVDASIERDPHSPMSRPGVWPGRHDRRPRDRDLPAVVPDLRDPRHTAQLRDAPVNEVELYIGVPIGGTRTADYFGSIRSARFVPDEGCDDRAAAWLRAQDGLLESRCEQAHRLGANVGSESR